MIKALFYLVAATLFFSAALTPPVYLLLEVLFNGEVPWPFSRVFNRVAMFFALIFVLILRRNFKPSDLVKAFSFADGLTRLKHLLAGFCITLGISMGVIFWCIHTEQFIPVEVSTGYLLTRVGKSLLSAIAVSIIEESFFRVLLLFALITQVGRVWGVVVTSLVYAVVHFISPARDWEYAGFGPLIGFDYLFAVIERIFQINVYAAIFGLFLVGSVLGLVMIRSGSIYLCIGLHAGWVVALKFTKYFATIGPEYEELVGVGRRFFFVAQPESWLSVVVVGILIYWWYRTPVHKLDTKSQS